MTNGDEVAELPFVSRHEIRGGDSYFTRVGEFLCCLYIYPMDEWEAFEEKLRALPLTNKDARAFSRFFVAGATTCELDKQGRILVPQTLREFAGLEKDVILAGNLSRVEVWSKEKWSENCNYDDMDSIAADMENMGIVI